eukprot:GHVQ01043017.1.p1 GENE.GHVQ01043017.1~~GHVQ01043017.1.p1  ORF type:complete len:205 (+),score=29.49 GHVQ01043017.1:85-699(+)
MHGLDLRTEGKEESVSAPFTEEMCVEQRDEHEGVREKEEGWWSVNLVFAFLVLINFVVYLDRGIIPGASSEFVEFVEITTEAAKPDVYVGALQSAFIIGLSVAAVCFGSLAETYPRFYLMGVGLLLWNIAALFIGRLMSGVGEASFITVAPPMIQDYGGHHQGRWLSGFYAMIPFGTAVGFGYGSIVASISALRWPMAFLLLFP